MKWSHMRGVWQHRHHACLLFKTGYWDQNCALAVPQWTVMSTAWLVCRSSLCDWTVRIPGKTVSPVQEGVIVITSLKERVCTPETKLVGKGAPPTNRQQMMTRRSPRQNRMSQRKLASESRVCLRPWLHGMGMAWRVKRHSPCFTLKGSGRRWWEWDLHLGPWVAESLSLRGELFFILRTKHTHNTHKLTRTLIHTHMWKFCDHLLQQQQRPETTAKTCISPLYRHKQSYKQWPLHFNDLDWSHPFTQTT